MNTANLLDRFAHLPVMPGLALHLICSVQDEGIKRDELVRLITADPALVVQLLRIVNSPFYGFSGRIVAIDDAVSLLGLNLVRRIVIATVMGRSGNATPTGSSPAHGFWHDQLMVAGLNRQLADNCDPELAYIAGLLHQIGRLALCTLDPAPCAPLGLTDSELLAFERRHCGTDHAELGAELMRCWNLPQTLVEAARDYATTERPATPLAALVWRSRQLLHQLWAQPELAQQANWLDAQGLSAPTLARLIDEVQQFCIEFEHV